MRSANLLLATLLLATSGLLQAGEPMTIEADSATLDDRRGVSLYRDNVVVVRGDLTLHADEVTVHHEQRQLDRVVARGRPARMHQRPAQGEATDGEGRHITWFAENEVIHLEQQARLTRGDDLFTGERIVYETTTQIVRADGQGGRVRAVIQSRERGTAE